MSAIPRLGLSVVMCTYEWPEALDVALRALSEEQDDFDIVVADDGSGPATREVVERWMEALPGRVEHVWQENEGWRQARIRNLGALKARGDLLLFLDGDCLVRRGFAKAVRRASLAGWFLGSKRLHLSRQLSADVLESHVPVWRWSTFGWIVRAPGELVSSHREAGSPGVLLPLRDRRRPWRRAQPEFSPPYDAYGFFLGVRREDFERVNGFDMRFVGWGGEDEDLAARLRRIGLRCGWSGPGATLLHLWHPPRKGSMASNRPRVEETKASERAEAVEGLRQLAGETSRTSTAPSPSA